MENLKREVLIYRWSLITAGLITCFWAIWYFIAGQVPVVSEIKLFESKNESWIIELPFSISRWWDILIGPIGSIIIVSIFNSKKIRKDKELSTVVVGLVSGLGFSLGFGLVSGLVFGLVSGLVFGLVFGLVSGLVFGLGSGLVFGLILGLGFGLGIGLVSGLVFGLVFGLAVGLGFGLGFGLGIGLAATLFLFKYLFSKRFWHTIRNWLIAKPN